MTGEIKPHRPSHQIFEQDQLNTKKTFCEPIIKPISSVNLNPPKKILFLLI